MQDTAIIEVLREHLRITHTHGTPTKHQADVVCRHQQLVYTPIHIIHYEHDTTVHGHLLGRRPGS